MHNNGYHYRYQRRAVTSEYQAGLTSLHMPSMTLEMRHIRVRPGLWPAPLWGNSSLVLSRVHSFRSESYIVLLGEIMTLPRLPSRMGSGMPLPNWFPTFSSFMASRTPKFSRLAPPLISRFQGFHYRQMPTAFGFRLCFIWSLVHEDRW